jgi:GTPase SAR1 family protein
MESDQKPLRLFISYSHEDESHLQNFVKHLITLKRNGVIKEWYDKKLVSGDKLDSEIQKNLLDSDIVAFIVSVDFLNSLYCYEVELKQTLNRLPNSDIRVVPIIVRKCDWTQSELGNYLAATKDGKPVTKYDDVDEAWAEVVESIEKACKKLLELPPKVTNSNSSAEKPFSFKQNDNFIKFLSDTGVVFQHNHKDFIILDDIYIYPDLKNLKKEYNKLETAINSSQLLNINEINSEILILGDEQTGKTSLAKKIYKNFLEQGYIPFYCSGEEIQTTNPEKLVNSISKNQYLEIDDFSSIEKVLIVDDFDKTRLNTRYQPNFIENVSNYFSKVILLSNSTIRFDDYRYVILSNFEQYEILPFGHVRRGELIDKWNCIGNGETLDLAELQKKNDITTHHIDAIIRKNIISPKPFYILMTLQMLSSSLQSDYSLTSYGHCYQSLIQNALLRTKIKIQEFDLYINYLTELAFFIFNANGNEIDNDQLKKFQTEYSNKFLIESHAAIINSLLNAGILKTDGLINRFNYRYIYYFYVAKYLSEHIQEKQIKEKIEYLADNIHTEKNANIIIFLTHHSRDRQIIDEVLFRALAVFEDLSEARLDLNETKYLSKFMHDIPQLVAEYRNPEKEREKALKIKDELESDIDNKEEIDDTEEDKSIFSDITRSLRIIETIGQILKNRHGSLEKKDLIDLAQSACSSGLKFLTFYLNVTRSEETQITAVIQNALEKNTELPDDKLASLTKKIFLMLCYGVSYGVIKRIVNSLGSDKLISVFEEVKNIIPSSPTIQLICIAIKLEFSKTIPKSEIEGLFNELKKNPFTRRLLQEIIVQHLYLNTVDYKDRHWISSKLGIPMKNQQLIQSKGKVD